MNWSPLESPSARLLERDHARVLEPFRGGDFDYVEGIGEVSEADFFRAVSGRKILEKLAVSYPSPRQKHDVPLWACIACDVSMRFHGEHHFHAFPILVRAGSLNEAFGPAPGRKVTRSQTGDVSLCCEGFNRKNVYDRQTPCDQDYLRKLARDTEAGALEQWFDRDVVGIFKQHHAFTRRGFSWAMPPTYSSLTIPVTRAPPGCCLTSKTIPLRSRT